MNKPRQQRRSCEEVAQSLAELCQAVGERFARDDTRWNWVQSRIEGLHGEVAEIKRKSRGPRLRG